MQSMKLHVLESSSDYITYRNNILLADDHFKHLHESYWSHQCLMTEIAEFCPCAVSEGDATRLQEILQLLLNLLRLILVVTSLLSAVSS